MEPVSTESDTQHQGEVSPVQPPKGSGTDTGMSEVGQGNHAPLKNLFKVLGPGLITGASDDDPSGIGTYTAAGASLGYSTLWTALLTFPLMTVVQYLCAKVGMASGRGLAGVLKKYYSPWVVYPAVFALFLANTINIGADLGAIAAAMNLFLPLPIPLLIVPVTLILLALQIWGSYRLIEQIFRWLTLALFAYIVSAFVAHPDGLALLKGTFLPTFRVDGTFIATLVAIIGTTISPYLFFWQSDQEVEDAISKGKTNLKQRQRVTKKELRLASWDVTVGMLISNVVMYCIILATAATLFRTGKHDIQSATDAAQALRPIAGNFASILLSIGLIGSGCLGVPVLAGSAAYALSEAFGWKYGLERRPGGAKHFYAIIVVAMLTGMLMNFLGINPISALFWTAVINGILAPPLLVLLMLIVNNEKIMKKRTNGLWLNIFGWLTTTLMFVAAIALLLTLGKS
ncbi:Nramp family divalent metal transporter [Ktedonobacter sp. SOSP1-52]|uniref:Nramp family divalent metal transporter n=1 Tax=Ktedonobacter sp. SOSP1-52 TaxID=2778366 RepID=UPI001914DAA3|nr:Nramp family divalent metal transporter [Ktedonobacter sp. SOSP1-52]